MLDLGFIEWKYLSVSFTCAHQAILKLIIFMRVLTILLFSDVLEKWFALDVICNFSKVRITFPTI